MAGPPILRLADHHEYDQRDDRVAIGNVGKELEPWKV